MEVRYKITILLMMLLFFPGFVGLCFSEGVLTDTAGEIDFRSLREVMIDTQIKKRGISDERVINAMLKVERHRFVSSQLRYLAYGDYPVSIGMGQTISQPYIVALMTELLELKGNHKVLEIGTGSGYQAAILAELTGQVYSIEILPELAIRAEKLLNELGYVNIKIKCGDGYMGWPEFAPFEGIIVTAAPPEIPQALVDQLAEGGRMVIPVGKAFQELKVLTKIKGEILIKNIIPVRFVPMIKKDQTQSLYLNP